jgi:prepilin-type N-terminal cleavage/methylation domain-containing protein/prepilin-type processing-associated H-X9-DG protein
VVRRSHQGSARRAFTLIELLVVIAIIGILAAMLFPVFARARESARKTQCLANVKNIAMAFQIYLTDYDAFYPKGNGQKEAVDYVTSLCGGCRLDCAPTQLNPYLRVPVILDEYIKSRDVWRCPSAKMSTAVLNGLPINPCTPDWLTALKANDNCPMRGDRVCVESWPPGWGGATTDTTVQGQCAQGPGAFDQSVGTPCPIRARKMSEMRNVSATIVCLDAGVSMEAGRTSAYAYPDMSKYDQLLTGCGGGGNGGTWSQDDCGNPTVASQCSPLALSAGGDGRWTKDVSYRKTFSRHMGGDNLGFADGHAKWYNAEQVLNGGVDHSRHGIHPQQLYGICDCFNPTAQPRSDFPVPNDPNGGLL